MASRDGEGRASTAKAGKKKKAAAAKSRRSARKTTRRAPTVRRAKAKKKTSPKKKRKSQIPKKAAHGAGPVVEEAERMAQRPRRHRPGTVALRDIRKLQKGTGNLIKLRSLGPALGRGLHGWSGATLAGSGVVSP